MVHRDNEGYFDLSKYIQANCTVEINGWNYQCEKVDENSVYVTDEYKGGFIKHPISAVEQVYFSLPDNQGTISASKWYIRYRNHKQELHRIDGPAVIRSTTTNHESLYSYWIDGDKYTEDQFRMITFTLHKQAQNVL